MSADNAKRWELIQKAEKVASFHKESLSSEVRNALIGGGIGATVGGVSPYVQSMLGAEEDEDDPNSRKAMRRAVLGGLGGAALGGGYSMLNPEEAVADTGSDEGAGDEGAGDEGAGDEGAGEDTETPPSQVDQGAPDPGYPPGRDFEEERYQEWYNSPAEVERRFNEGPFGRGARGLGEFIGRGGRGKPAPAPQEPPSIMMPDPGSREGIEAELQGQQGGGDNDIRAHMGAAELKAHNALMAGQPAAGGGREPEPPIIGPNNEVFTDNGGDEGPEYGPAMYEENGERKLIPGGIRVPEGSSHGIDPATGKMIIMGPDGAPLNTNDYLPGWMGRGYPEAEQEAFGDQLNPAGDVGPKAPVLPGADVRGTGPTTGPPGLQGRAPAPGYPPGYKGDEQEAFGDQLNPGGDVGPRAPDPGYPGKAEGQGGDPAWRGNTQEQGRVRLEDEGKSQEELVPGKTDFDIVSEDPIPTQVDTGGPDMRGADTPGGSAADRPAGQIGPGLDEGEAADTEAGKPPKKPSSADEEAAGIASQKEKTKASLEERKAKAKAKGESKEQEKESATRTGLTGQAAGAKPAPDPAGGFKNTVDGVPLYSHDRNARGQTIPDPSNYPGQGLNKPPAPPSGKPHPRPGPNQGSAWSSKTVGRGGWHPDSEGFQSFIGEPAGVPNYQATQDPPNPGFFSIENFDEGGFGDDFQGRNRIQRQRQAQSARLKVQDPRVRAGDAGKTREQILTDRYGPDMRQGTADDLNKGAAVGAYFASQVLGKDAGSYTKKKKKKKRKVLIGPEGKASVRAKKKEKEKKAAGPPVGGAANIRPGEGNNAPQARRRAELVPSSTAAMAAEARPYPTGYRVSRKNDLQRGPVGTQNLDGDNRLSASHKARTDWSNEKGRVRSQDAGKTLGEQQHPIRPSALPPGYTDPKSGVKSTNTGQPPPLDRSKMSPEEKAMRDRSQADYEKATRGDRYENIGYKGMPVKIPGSQSGPPSKPVVPAGKPYRGPVGAPPAPGTPGGRQKRSAISADARMRSIIQRGTANFFNR